MRSISVVHVNTQGSNPAPYLQSVNMYIKERFHASPRAPEWTYVTQNLIVYSMSLLFLTKRTSILGYNNKGDEPNIKP